MFRKNVLCTVAMLFVLTLLSAQKDGKEFHLPKTVSKEAQAVLKNWSLEGRNKGARLPKSNAPIEEWEILQKQFAEAASQHVSIVIDKYEAKIDTVYYGGIRAVSVTPKNYTKTDRVLVYLHGGAFTFYPADVTLVSSVPLSHETGLKIITIDYSLAPQAKYSEITDEVIKFYKGLLKDYSPEHIGFYGDSAGGAIAAGTILKMRDYNISLPSVLVLWSGWLDINNVGDSYFTLKDQDPNLVYSDFLENCAEAYAPKSEWKNPYVSPVYGDFSKDFPPTLIQVGGKEIFLSNSIRMYRNLKENGRLVELDVYEGMWHVWQGYYEVPESKMAIKNTKEFINKYLYK